MAVNIALLVIDLQYGFFEEGQGAVGRLEKSFALQGTRRLLHYGRGQGWLVVHAVTTHSGVHTLPYHHRSQGMQAYCLRGTPGAEVVRGLVDPADRIVEKQAYNAFQETDLATAVRSVDRLVVTGVATDCCVLATALDATVRLEADIYVPFDAVSASTLDQYLAGLNSIRKSAAAVLSVCDLLTPAEGWAGRRLGPEDLFAIAGNWYRQRHALLEGWRSQTDRGEVEKLPEVVEALESELALLEARN